MLFVLVPKNANVRLLVRVRVVFMVTFEFEIVEVEVPDVVVVAFPIVDSRANVEFFACSVVIFSGALLDAIVAMLDVLRGVRLAVLAFVLDGMLILVAIVLLRAAVVVFVELRASAAFIGLALPLAFVPAFVGVVEVMTCVVTRGFVLLVLLIVSAFSIRVLVEELFAFMLFLTLVLLVMVNVAVLLARTIALFVEPRTSMFVVAFVLVMLVMLVVPVVVLVDVVVPVEVAFKKLVVLNVFFFSWLALPRLAVVLVVVVLFVDVRVDLLIALVFMVGGSEMLDVGVAVLASVDLSM